jgi:hypothetical protein
MDLENIPPLVSIENWFSYCKKNRNYFLALMGENGDPEFENLFKRKVCEEINRMMDDEHMPKDGLRPYCVELTYSIHYSLMKFSLQVEEEGLELFDAHQLTSLANYWRACAVRAEKKKGIPLSKEDYLE